MRNDMRTCRRVRLIGSIIRRILVIFLVLLLVCYFTGCEVRQGQPVKGPNNNVDEVMQHKTKKGNPWPNQDLSGKDYSSLSQKYESWWFKRNMDHLPSGAQEEIDIKKYNAYYIDESAIQGKHVDKVIYLTFDCGYDNGFTEGMLDVLKKHKAKATFFVTQTYIRDSLPIVKRMKKEGHYVGNHTITHPNLTTAPVDKIEQEIVGCQKYMKEATGYEMDPFFRPPKGEYSEYLLQVAKDLGYKTIFWSMAYLDYDVNHQPSAQHVIEHWQKYYHPGAIPLLHNVSSANAEALDTILTNLEKEGYHFGKLSDMVCD